MKAVKVLIILAIVCSTVPAGANVRALYTMTQNDGDIFMVDSSGYGNDLLVGPLGGSPNGDWCWDNPGVFTAYDSTIGQVTTAGKDLDIWDPGNTSLYSGMENDLIIEADINLEWGGNWAPIVSHNSSSDYGLFTQTQGNGQYVLNYSSYAVIATGDADAGWFNIYDTTLLDELTWYHVKVIVDRNVGDIGGVQIDRVSFFVTDMVNPTSSFLIGNNSGGGAQAGRIEVMGLSGDWGKYNLGKLDNLMIDITIPEPSIMLVGLLAMLKLRRK